MEPSAQTRHEYREEIRTAEQFDFDEIDRHLIEENPEHPDSQAVRAEMEREERSSLTADLLRALLDHALPTDLSKSSIRAAGARIVALGWMTGSGKCGLAGMSLNEIAERTGVTRALLSHYVRRFEDAFAYHARGQKSTLARESYVSGASRGWETRRKKQASEA
ncbi:MAG: hypothetical protein NTZ46_11800 [Verrucomicrobia bacterium]|nr:hypothetical protein [Verrucomicrobiota bacterium]